MNYPARALGVVELDAERQAGSNVHSAGREVANKCRFSARGELRLI